MNNFKKLSIAGLLAAGLSLAGCMGENSPVALDDSNAPDVVLKISTGVGAVNPTGLSKANLITLSKVIVVLSSNASTPDTVRDTILVGGPEGLSASVATSQNVTKNYTVKGLRTWSVNVSVRDSKDSVTHTGSAVTASPVRVADTAAVSLSLNSRFAMYEAIFANLPDSITTSSGSGHKQNVTYKRLVLKVNGVTVRDSTSPTTFAKGTGSSHSLVWDYVAVTNSPTTHNIRLIAYGSTGATWVNDSLFAGNTTVLAVQAGSADSAKTVTMGWVGPNNGTEKMTVTIGRVGKITLTGGGYGSVPKTK